jgi:hypothetical protein
MKTSLIAAAAFLLYACDSSYEGKYIGQTCTLAGEQVTVTGYGFGSNTVAIVEHDSREERGVNVRALKDCR